MNDNVNHPSHYTQGPVHDRCGEVVECITVTEAMNFNIGNAVKYLWRCDDKNGGVDALQDLEKARWYIDREIQRRKYEAARNELSLFEDDVKPARDFKDLGFTTAKDLKGFTTMGGFGPKASGHTHLTGPAFDIPVASPLAGLDGLDGLDGLWSTLFGADEPDNVDTAPDDADEDTTLDDTNSHVCLNGKRTPGTFCFGRWLSDALGLNLSGN